MPFIGVTLCGARCRTKGGKPCKQPAMRNGRCKMHGGQLYKREKHGERTLRAIERRKHERVLLREMKGILEQVQEADKG